MTAAGPPPDGLLRPVLQLAVDVARAGAAADPPVEPPRPLRPFVRFQKLPDSALAAVRRALDEDEAFRTRVGHLADEVELGRAGWLFVARPDGWQEELAGLVGEAERRAEAEREEREERSARRRVAAAEAANQRAEEAAVRARAEAEAAAARLATERRERRAVQEEAAHLARRAASLEGERDSARRKAETASAEAEALRLELEAVRAELAARSAEAEHLRARPEPVVEPPPGSGLDVAGVASAVSEAASAAAALGRALAEASAALGGAATPPATTSPVPSATASRPAEARRPPPAPRPRRRPPALPPAVLDDTAEAAAHLVRVAGVLVLVDGYNAAKLLWPDLAPAALRERLVDALAELEARSGASIHVVFDGADVGAPPPRAGGRRAVRVTFSPAGVEADDLILDLLGDVPLERPVVVASSDRRVQDGARARGAAVISSVQLASVLRRS